VCGTIRNEKRASRLESTLPYSPHTGLAHLWPNGVELRASGNPLTVLPDSIGRLTRLRELHLRNNKLTMLPESLEKLQELRQIDLRGNPPKCLPAIMAELPRLDKRTCGG
jgi:hypothetical protein